MDIQQLITILKDLGIPAAISAVLTVLVKTLIDARQRNSKESLLDWLAQASAVEPFKDDDKALRALLELQQSLVFERAFGLKAESKLRNELLAFAESQHESMRFQEVLGAGRLVSRLSLARLQNPKQLKAFKFTSRIVKPMAYFYVGAGYLLFIGGMYLPDAMDWSGRLELTSVVVGLVFGSLTTLLGMSMFKQARLLEIAASFLGWRSENRQNLLQVRSEHTTTDTNHSA